MHSLSPSPSLSLAPLCQVREVDCEGAWIYMGGGDRGALTAGWHHL